MTMLDSVFLTRCRQTWRMTAIAAVVVYTTINQQVGGGGGGSLISTYAITTQCLNWFFSHTIFRVHRVCTAYVCAQPTVRVFWKRKTIAARAANATNRFFFRSNNERSSTDVFNIYILTYALSGYVPVTRRSRWSCSTAGDFVACFTHTVVAVPEKKKDAKQTGASGLVRPHCFARRRWPNARNGYNTISYVFTRRTCVVLTTSLPCRTTGTGRSRPMPVVQ